MKYDWEKLDNLCLKYYIDRDPSHGIDHIMSVLDNLDLLLITYPTLESFRSNFSESFCSIT